MTTATENANPSLLDSQPSGDRLTLYTGAVLAAAVFLILYGIWPYQHGHLDERVSVLKGLFILVTSSAGSEWIFCLFVPFITGLLIYLRRDSLRGVPIEGSNWAILPLLLSLLIYWVGYKADTRFLGFASAQIMVAALILWLLGWQYLRLLIFPWLFLAFMWPFPPLEEMLAFPLQILAAKSSAAVLNVIGVDCVREGTAIISLADPAQGYERGDLFQLNVDQPCSGIRSLFSLIMISVFYGYISLPKVGQRLVLFASAIPLAVAGNVVRMVMLAVGCILFGTEFAVGTDYPSTYHELSGIVVFVVALTGMFSISRLLEARSGKRKRKKKKKDAEEAGETAATGSRIPYWRSAAVLGAAAVTLLACYLAPAASGLSEPGVAATLPTSLPGYWGHVIPPSKGEKEQLIDVGVGLSRVHFESASGPPVTATVVVGGPEGRTLHRPEVCLPGQGWQVVGTERTTVDLGAGSPVKATLLTIARSETNQDGIMMRRQAFNLYWYVGHDCTAASYNEHIARSVTDGIVRNLYHRWSMISLFTSLPVGSVENPLAEAEAVDALKNMAKGVVPAVASGPWLE